MSRIPEKREDQEREGAHDLERKRKQRTKINTVCIRFCIKESVKR